jgi:hypothetical protein
MPGSLNLIEINIRPEILPIVATALAEVPDARCLGQCKRRYGRTSPAGDTEKCLDRTGPCNALYGACGDIRSVALKCFRAYATSCASLG